MNRPRVTEQQQGAGRHLSVVAYQTQRVSDLSIRQAREHRVRPGARLGDKTPHPLELKRIKVVPSRTVDRQGCVVNGSAINLVGKHLVGVVGDTRGPTVAADSAAKIGSPGGAHYPGTVGDLHDDHRSAVEIHDAHAGGHGRLGVVGDERL
jgi:hypothetical protein